MSATHTCPQCGTALPAGTPPWICPQCLLGQATAGEPGEASASPGASGATPVSASPLGGPLPCRLGAYELVERIGQGGMGVVYKARQISLDRDVAVKVLSLAALAGREAVHRFRTEAVTAGSLQHPNIVAVHEVGLAEGQHYLVMDYVPGPTLADLTRNDPLPGRRAAQYLRTIAEAVHFAHERGILHRDLKPSNVLIDADDQPRVTDFGLAKRLPGESQIPNPKSEMELTLSGQVLGSPAFIPPEQASGQRGRVGRRSDVYALGAILFQMLTGRPPFVGEALADTLRQVLNEEPPGPRLLNPTVPLELETVCLKCLEKEPDRRYPTAQALAEELGRFLENRPILAHPTGPAAKVWRWCWRKPALASLGAGVIVLLLMVAIGSPLALYHLNRARQRAEAEALLARRNAYAADMNLVQVALRENDLASARERLNRHRPPGKFEARSPNSEVDLRGWEWRYLWALAWFTNGQDLVAGGRDASVRFWDPGAKAWTQYAVLPENIWFWGPAFLSDSKTFLTVTQPEGAVVRWETATLRQMERWSFLGTNHLSLEVSRDDRWLVLGDTNGNVRVWDLPGRQLVTNLVAPAPTVFGLMFSPGSTLLNCGAFNSDRGIVIRTWSAAEWHEVSLPGHDFKEVLEPAFAPDERTLALGYRDGTAAWWDLKTGQRHEVFDCESPGAINVAFSPDGRFFATVGKNGRVILWDRDIRQTKSLSPGIRNAVYDLAFSPDGSRLAGSGTGLKSPLQLWDVETGRDLLALPGEPGRYVHIGFSPDGSTLFAASLEGAALLWRAPSWEEIEAAEKKRQAP